MAEQLLVQVTGGRLLVSVKVETGNESSYTTIMYFSYTILANREVKPHAPTIYKSKLVADVSINTNSGGGLTFPKV